MIFAASCAGHEAMKAFTAWMLAFSAGVTSAAAGMAVPSAPKPIAASALRRVEFVFISVESFAPASLLLSLIESLQRLELYGNAMRIRRLHTVVEPDHILPQRRRHAIELAGSQLPQ